jgi:hypothetical protein
MAKLKIVKSTKIILNEMELNAFITVSNILEDIKKPEEIYPMSELAETLEASLDFLTHIIEGDNLEDYYDC